MAKKLQSFFLNFIQLNKESNYTSSKGKPYSFKYFRLHHKQGRSNSLTGHCAILLWSPLSNYFI